MLNNSSIKRLAARAAEAAAQIPCAMSIAIVDDGANLAYLERMDGAMIGSVEAARRKARCAVLFKRPTKGIFPNKRPNLELGTGVINARTVSSWPDVETSFLSTFGEGCFNSSKRAGRESSRAARGLVSDVSAVLTGGN